MKFRQYQKDCLEKIKWSLNLEGNDLISLPTGSGKSVIIANIANFVKKDILILQPSLEILEQNKKKLLQYVDEKEVGVYSASFNSKEIKKYTFATIGSVYKIPKEFAHFTLVIIDECHLLNPKDASSMFLDFIKKIGNPKVIGLSATLYRIFPTYFIGEDKQMYQSNSIKMINRLKERFWSRIIYSIDHIELLNLGYLSKIKYVDKTQITQEMIPLNKSKTDFDFSLYDTVIAKIDKDIVELITQASKKHKSVLVFCNSIIQSSRLLKYFENARTVSSESSNQDRREAIQGFTSGKVKIVFNVGVLTTGFDMPELDCIVLLRPTRSVTLYYQMLGRGVRLAKGKEFCTVYDFTDTVKKIGRIETIQIKRIANEKGVLQWELLTETQSWHGKELYKFKVEKRNNISTLIKK
jgi:DNA repair protein RadD